MPDGGQLKREFESIAVEDDEASEFFFARAEGKLNALSTLGIHRTAREILRLIARRLPAEFNDVE